MINWALLIITLSLKLNDFVGNVAASVWFLQSCLSRVKAVKPKQKTMDFLWTLPFHCKWWAVLLSFLFPNSLHAPCIRYDKKSVPRSESKACGTIDMRNISFTSSPATFLPVVYVGWARQRQIVLISRDSSIWRVRRPQMLLLF